MSETTIAEEPEVREGTKRRKQIRRLLLVLVLVAAAAAYLIGVLIFQNRFYGRDMLFGIEAACKTADELKEEISEKVGEYQITVVTRTGEEVITAQEIGLEFSDTGIVDELLEAQNPWLWITGFFETGEDTDIDVEYDAELFDSRLAECSFLDEESMQEPADAYLEYSGGSFQIVTEDSGTQLDADEVLAVIASAVLDGETEVDLDAAGCYTESEIYSDNEDLIAEMEEVNALIDVEIIYDFSDRTETVDSDLISEWIVFGDDFTWELDRDLVYDYVYELGLEYDTFGLSREFTTTGGETITLTGGDYGWLIGKDDTTDELIALIEAGESCTTEPVYRYTGVCRDTDDIGGTYVEVSISEQTMWCYEDGELAVTASVVTGLASDSDRATPSGGVWAIDAKMTDYYLVGQGYNSYVNYWMPFNGNVGIHDASWRSSFGGSIYKTNGSHGCVNTTYSAAQAIYAIVEIGTPVIVY